MFEKFKEWLNKKVNEKEVDRTLKMLADYQEGKITDTSNKERDLLKAAAVIKKNPKLITEKGFEYLKDFAEYYPKSGLSSTTLVSKIITDCITAKNGANASKRLEDIISAISSGKAKSISQEKAKTSFVLTTNIGIMVNGDDSGGKRVKAGTKDYFIKGGMNDDAEKLTETIVERYPTVAGIIGKGDSLQQDMMTVIGNGSQKMEGQQCQAARYLELREFEKGVKDQVRKYAQAGNIETPEAQEYLKKAAIQAAEHLRADYATGLDRGRTDKDINAQLGRITNTIQFIETGVKPSTLSPKVMNKVEEIVQSHPTLAATHSPKALPQRETSKEKSFGR